MKLIEDIKHRVELNIHLKIITGAKTYCRLLTNCNMLLIPDYMTDIVDSNVIRDIVANFGKNWETEEELLPSGHQAPKHKPSLINTYKIVTEKHSYSHHPYC